MMKPEEYTDLIIKLTIAFIIPLRWAAILYPLMKKSRKAWPFLLITSILLSFALLAVKEMMDQVTPIFDEIVTYLFGIFLGSAVLSLLFNFGNSWLKELSKIGAFLETSRGVPSSIS